MKSTIGDAISITVFGESHGQAIGVVIDGLCPGIPLDMDYMNAQLDLRKPKGKISTQRKEKDLPNIISGYFNGYTTGTPLCMLFENSNTRSNDYDKTRYYMRPSHADYSGQIKYLGYQDYRGGGHFSGRLTAPIVAAGAICKQILADKGIIIGSHIRNIKDIYDEPFANDEDTLQTQLEQLNQSYFPAINADKKEEMLKYMENCALNKDSCGGVIESAILHLPAGIGEPMFHSIESTLSHLLFSVPALKGVEFGLGFEFANYKGSECNDAFYYDEKHHIKTRTNNNAGINGGISNGMPIIIKCVIKPTPSIFKTQQTIHLKKEENVDYAIEGRHDPAIIHRARVVIDSMIAIGLLDLMVQRYGYLWMGGKQQWNMD